MIHENDDLCKCANCEGEVDAVEPLLLTIFNQGQEAGKAQEYPFCSWECVFDYLPGVCCDYFVDLPFLHYDDNRTGDGVQAFLKLIKRK